MISIRALASLPSLMLLGLAGFGFAAAESSASPADTLADGTVVRHFQLKNGLRVVTHDIPKSGAIAITAGYGFGTEHDPEGREGLMTLLAHARFMAAIEGAPERNLDALNSARPLGWNVEVTRRATRLTEVANLQQFPGVLHQVALRMRAANVSPKILAAAQADVRKRLAHSYRDAIPSALYHQVREAAGPGDLARAERYAAARGTENVTVEVVNRLLVEWFVPANAVLSLAGDLGASGMDVARVLETEFGSIPKGSPAPATAAARPDSAVRWVVRTDLTEPVGVVGVIAPALTDSTHPSLLLHAVLFGSSFSARWPRTATTPSRFQYLLFDDPDLVRIYPIVTLSDYEVGFMREEYVEGMRELMQQSIKPAEYQSIQAGLRWMLGGPLTTELRGRLATNRDLLMTLAANAATRELWGGEDFWREYRRRYDAIDRPTLGGWADYFTDPVNLVQVMFRFAPEASGK